MSKWLALAALAAALASPALAAPDVVVTIKPIHSLVAAVMGDVATPHLIVRGGASPHTYALKPSDARALEAADLVFWTGHGMELFLDDALESLAGDATVVELVNSPGIELLPIREGGAFEPHEHEGEHEGEEGHEAEHDHDHEEHGELDMHFWLDPQNAAKMVDAIAAALSAADPENAAAYAANAAAEKASLTALEAELAAALAPVVQKPFVVFHDAYQYFERRFGLTVAGSVTVSPEAAPGVHRVGELQEKLRDLGTACIFAEPQFEPAIVRTIAEGTGAGIGTLDPEGASLTEGPGLYAELLRGLARSIVECLGV